jgi:hypothetical protein
MTDRKVAGRRTIRLRVECGDLWFPDIDVVAVEWFEAEVPHNLGRDLRVVRIK